MSFSRLRRSKRYEDAISIYEQVQDQPFFGRQVGLTHSTIAILKNYGDIVILKDRQKITTNRGISYKVSRYQLSQNAVNKIREDIANNKITVNIRPTVLETLKEKSNIVNTEIVIPKKKYTNVSQ